MNLFQVVKSLQTIALTNPYVRNVGDGSIYTFMDANPQIRYGVFFVSQTNHRENELFDWYGLNLFCVDRLVDDLETNRLQIQSIAKDVLSNTIHTFINKFIGVTVPAEIRYTPFTQKFSDLCAGEYCSVEFKIPKAIICEEYFEDMYPINPDCPDCPECEDCDGYYQDGYDSGFTDGVNSVICPDCDDCQPFFDSGYTSGYTSGYDSGYTDGVNSVICPDCPDCDGYYQSGYTSGHTDGYQEGINYQKSLLSSTAITHNGNYVSENGFSAVTVNIPQTGETINNQNKSVKLSVNGVHIISYDTGYTGLGQVDITVAVPTGHTDQEMADMYQSGYTDGVNSVICPDCDEYYQSGYTSGSTDGYQSGWTAGYESGSTDGYNSGFTGGYDSGRTDGIDYQKSLLGSTAITENGTYTREDGWSAVTVNINTQGYYDQGYEDAMKEQDRYGDIPLTVQVISGGTLYYKGEHSEHPRTVEYSKNYGEWTSITSTSNGVQIPVVSGDNVRFRGNIDASDNYGCGQISSDSGARCNLYGNIMSMLSSSGYSGMTTTIGNGTFQHFFKELAVVDASKLVLPADTLTPACYYHMFISCMYLIAPPALPATNLAEYCYQGMFELCSNLTTAPDLNATTLVEGCYMYMFKNTELNYLRCMATNIYQSIIPTDALFGWVVGVSPTGTFVKSSSTNWVGERTDPGPGYGQDGVPANELQKWTIVNA